MRVFRVENLKGHGPVFGVKSYDKVFYDYRDNERFVESYKTLFCKRGEPFDESVLYGYENVSKFYYSKEVIIDHKTPRENKPYFHGRFDSTFGYYRFGNMYSFGWNTFEKCLNFVEKGKKKKWILHREGFFISEYESRDNIIFPDGQIVFKIKRAKISKKYINVFC